MIFEALSGDEEILIREISSWTLFVQGIATSIDALSVGFTISNYGPLMAFTASLMISLKYCKTEFIRYLRSFNSNYGVPYVRIQIITVLANAAFVFARTHSTTGQMCLAALVTVTVLSRVPRITFCAPARA